jgi:hypothetical protein
MYQIKKEGFMKAKIVAFFMILAVLTLMAGGEAMALEKVNFQLNWKSPVTMPHIMSL